MVKKFDGVTEKLTHDVLQDLYKFEVYKIYERL